MIAQDEEALICDFAETYCILDYKQLGVNKAAILANGLRDDSRIKKSIANAKVSIDVMLLASIADSLSVIIKSLTGHKEKLFLITDLLRGDKKSNSGFDTSSEFNKQRKAILEGVV